MESLDILLPFVGHRGSLHMAFRIRFVTDEKELAVLRQVEKELWKRRYTCK